MQPASGCLIEDQWYNPDFGAASVDVDGDGRVDRIVLASETAQLDQPVLEWFRLGANGTYAAPRPLFTDITYARDLTAGDLDGDGDQDLVVSGAVGELFGIFAYYDNGGVLGAALTPLVPTGPQAVAPAIALLHLDNDGALDLWASPRPLLLTPDTAAVGLGPDFRTWVPVPFDPGTREAHFQFVDIDEDGTTDTLTRSDGVNLRGLTELATFDLLHPHPQRVALPLPLIWHPFRLHAGTPHSFVATTVDQYSTQSEILIVEQTAPWELSPPRTWLDGTNVHTVADLDGDGDDDILAQLGLDGEWFVHWNEDGELSAPDPTGLSRDDGWRIKRAIDVDGDGDDDLLGRLDSACAIAILHGPSTLPANNVLVEPESCGCRPTSPSTHLLGFGWLVVLCLRRRRPSE